jgi:hypothetical protein
MFDSMSFIHTTVFFSSSRSRCDVLFALCFEIELGKKSSKTTNDKLIPFIPVSFLILLSFLLFDSGVFADAVSALLSQP